MDHLSACNVSQEEPIICTSKLKFRVTLVSRNKAVSCMVLIERSTKVQNKHRMSTETAKENRTQLQSDESHQNINVRLKEERVREMQEWAGFCNGYLDDQFSRAEFKKFLDGLGTCVNDVTSPPHRSHQRSDCVTLGHRTNTHLPGGGGDARMPLEQITFNEENSHILQVF